MHTPIQTDSAPEARTILSQAIEADGIVFVSGQIPLTSEGILVDRDVPAMFAQIMSNIGEILNAAERSLHNIANVTIYVTDINLVAEINEVYSGYFSEVLPARTAICVQALPLGASIEVSVIAV